MCRDKFMIFEGIFVTSTVLLAHGVPRHPYVRTGSIWCSNILRETAALTLPVVLSACSHILAALLAFSTWSFMVCERSPFALICKPRYRMESINSRLVSPYLISAVPIFVSGTSFPHNHAFRVGFIYLQTHL